MTEFNPLAPEMAVDPYPHYAVLRERDPVHHSAMGFWVLTRHADVQAFFADRRLEHQYVLTQMARVGPDVESEPYFDLFRRMVFVLDNPDHRRIRQLFTTSFTPKRVNAMRGRVQAIADELIDQVAAARRMDIVEDFATPFPTRVIGELMGVPRADQLQIADLADALSPVLEFLPMAPDVLSTANDAVQELAAYFIHLAAVKRANPADDLFTAMVFAATEDAASAIDERELVANAINMYIAGHETTAGATGLAVLALHRHPDQLQLLVDDPDLIPGAAQELSRFDTAGQATARVATEAVVFGDVEIPAGNMILAYIGAANRDPAVYQDPDRLDLRRSVPGPVSFGGGAHFCIGHALARQELEVALGTLLRRCPGLTLESLDPPFRDTALMRGLKSLPAKW